MGFIKFLKTRYLIFLASIVAFGYYFYFLKKNSPTIEMVLKQQYSSFDYKYVLGFFALSIATLSFAKSYEILKKRREPKIIEDISSIGAEDKPEDDGKEEFIKALEASENENSYLKEKIQGFEDYIRQKTYAEDLYKKSVSSLKKAKEKLVEEKEGFLLEINRLHLQLDEYEKNKEMMPLIPRRKKIIQNKSKFQSVLRKNSKKKKIARKKKK